MRVELRALRLTLLTSAPLAPMGPTNSHDRRRNSDPETLRRLPGRRTGLDHPISKILAVGSRHPRLRRFATEDLHTSAQS